MNADTIRLSDASAFSPLPPDKTLGVLVDFKLLDQEAARRHISISPAEMQRRRQTIAADAHTASYGVAASSNHRTEWGMDQQIRHAAILEQLAAADVKPVPRSIVHACGVFIETGGLHASNSGQASSLAREIQSQLDNGVSVAALADRYSDDPVSRGHHGDFGIVENAIPMQMGFGADHRLFEWLTGAVARDRVTGPIVGDHGFWAVKVLSTVSSPKGEDRLYAPIREMWRNYWMQRLEPGVMARLRSKAKITPPLA